MPFGIENPSFVNDFVSLRSWLGILTSLVRNFYSVVTVTDTYTVASGVHYVRADATAGAFTVTLPPANSNLGRHIIVKKIDSSVNAVTVSRGGSDKIDGSNTVSLAAQWDKSQVIAGTNLSWEIV